MTNNLEGKTILWVEDDNFLGSIISRRLKKDEAEVIHANTGAKALEVLDENTPHLVLLDVLLPDKDGFEVLEFIKSEDRLKDIPVIMFSNLSQEENIEKSKEMGALDFYVKSNVSPDQIAEKAKEVLS
ncbi:MAG: response regulator [Patescibacteria group bacterium]